MATDGRGMPRPYGLLGARKEAILEAKGAEGEVVETYQALYTTRALADAEARLGKSVGLAISGFATGKSGIREIAILLQAGMEANRRASKAGGNPVSFDDACDVLDVVGLTPAANVIGPAITAVLQYGLETEGFAQEEAPEKNG